MHSRLHIRIALLLGLAALFVVPLQASGNSQPSPVSNQDPGIVAQKTAAANNQFLMVLFQRTNEPTPLTESFDAVRESLSGNLMSVVINTENSEESGLVNLYNVRWAPLPMVVVLAPNSAITGSFRDTFTPEHVKATFLSPVTQQCLLAFQQRKLVIVCVQGNSTTGNAEAMGGVTQFQEDPNMGKMTQVVIIDPDDPKEQSLLSQLRITAKPDVAETLLLAPPGKMLGKWTGATSKEAFTQVLMSQARAQKTCQISGCKDPACPPPQAPPTQGGVQ